LPTKTITGSYPTGYALDPSFDTLNVAATAIVGGAGITTTTAHLSTINNLGSVDGTANGITLSGGGVITNGSAGNTTALIQGLNAIVAYNAPATIKNSATIKSDAVDSNGYQVTQTSIVLNQGGAVVNAGTGQIANGLTVSGTSGTVTNIGAIGTWGKTKTTSRTTPYGNHYDTSDIQAFASVQMTAGGSVVNGAAGVTTSKISNGISITGGVGAVTNFGTIGGPQGKYSIVNDFSVGIRDEWLNETDGASIVLSAGTVTNAIGGAISNGIVIQTGGKIVNGGSIGQGGATDIYQSSSFGVALLKRYGTITQNYAVVLGGGGSLINGSTSNKAAVVNGGIKVGGAAGTIVNHGTISGSSYKLDVNYYNSHPGTRADTTRSTGYSVALFRGGQVTNGGDASTTAKITNGILITGGIAKVFNYGTISGSAQTAHYFEDFSGSSITRTTGYTIVLRTGGEVTNGSAATRTAAITGGISVEGASGKIVNHGTIQNTSADNGGTGIVLKAGGTIANGSASNTAALISGKTALTCWAPVRSPTSAPSRARAARRSDSIRRALA
jgi:hypothetical protein